MKRYYIDFPEDLSTRFDTVIAQCPPTTGTKAFLAREGVHIVCLALEGHLKEARQAVSALARSMPHAEK